MGTRIFIRPYSNGSQIFRSRKWNCQPSLPSPRHENIFCDFRRRLHISLLYVITYTSHQERYCRGRKWYWPTGVRWNLQSEKSSLWDEFRFPSETTFPPPSWQQSWHNYAATPLGTTNTTPQPTSKESNTVTTANFFIVIPHALRALVFLSSPPPKLKPFVSKYFIIVTSGDTVFAYSFPENLTFNCVFGSR